MKSSHAISHFNEFNHHKSYKSYFLAYDTFPTLCMRKKNSIKTMLLITVFELSGSSTNHNTTSITGQHIKEDYEISMLLISSNV
jgi:hypothetical protein